MRTNFLHKVIGTALGLGYIPKAPGTFGALGGLVFGWLIKYYFPYPDIILTIIAFITLFYGVYSSQKLIEEWGKDPSKVVIDEVVGMWVTILFVPLSVFTFVLAFMLFRLLDIYKPFYIKKLENVPGGWGIMLDDLGAGIISNLLVQIVMVIKALL